MMILRTKNTTYFNVLTINRHIRRSIYNSVPKYNDDCEYMQRSKLPTMYFQQSLPRLPIPKLEDSCKKYLTALQPILTPSEYKKSSESVAKFLVKDGPQLQKLLLEHDSKNKHTSYISEYWFDMYLRDRKALPINNNPLLVFIQETDPRYNNPLVKGTNLLVSSARFMKSLRAGILEPEIYHLNPKKSNTNFFRTFTKMLPTNIATYGAYLFKAFPIDMSQFEYLFGTTRIPNIEKDILLHNDTTRHIVIMRKGHYYSMDLLDINGQIRPPMEIAACLKGILEDTREPNPTSVGMLTTIDRDEWAKYRKHLIDIGNEKVFNKIDNAAFIFIIDDECVETNYQKLVQLFMHGDGTNRWFDKSFSLIMAGDGVSGINFEHSWGDGIAVLRYFTDLKHDIEDRPAFHPEQEAAVSSDLLSIEKLDFIVDDAMKAVINRVSNQYKEWISDRLSIDYLIHDEFGKEECKQFGVSPDAVMQVAFQLALYKQEKKAVATYESCSTAAFKHGRTETIRSCTNETMALCSAIVEQGSVSKSKNAEFKKLMIECSKAHNVLIKEGAMGKGFDRHLFALKKQWDISMGNDKLPSLYSDPAYAKLNHNILSTSTLSSPEVLAGGFGPVVEEGYGIAYMIQSHRLGSVVASYREHRDASEYVKYLESSFKDLHRILKGE